MNNEIIEHLQGELIIGTTYEEDINTIKDASSKAFLISGKILANIQDDKKYKDAGYKSFAEAIKIDFGIKKAYAYYLINSVKIYENLSTQVDTFLPTEERQLRPLSVLAPAQQIEVWQEVAKDKVPTAKEVKVAVDKRSGKIKIVKAKVANNDAEIIKILSSKMDEHIEVLLESDKENHILKEEIVILKNKVAELEKQLEEFIPKQKEKKPHDVERGEFILENRYKNISSEESIAYFQKRLKEDGIIN